jgi:hypothetical protein
MPSLVAVNNILSDVMSDVSSIVGVGLFSAVVRKLTTT